MEGLQGEYHSNDELSSTEQTKQMPCENSKELVHKLVQQCNLREIALQQSGQQRQLESRVCTLQFELLIFLFSYLST